MADRSGEKMNDRNGKATDSECNDGLPSSRSDQHSAPVVESLVVAALRAVGRITGVVFVVDCDRRQIVWTSPAAVSPSTAWPRDMENSIIGVAERCMLSHSPMPIPPDLPGATVISVAPFGHNPELRERFCAVQVVLGSVHPGALQKLSSRERDIARLLGEGYTQVNISARCDLATSTVRTYVRRIYAKLGVVNRMELARKLFGED